MGLGFCAASPGAGGRALQLSASWGEVALAILRALTVALPAPPRGSDLGGPPQGSGLACSLFPWRPQTTLSPTLLEKPRAGDAGFGIPRFALSTIPEAFTFGP